MAHAGLTSAEVRDRQDRGLVNRVSSNRWREYLGIITRNLVTWFNALVVPSALVLIQLGEWRGAVAVSGMMIVNTILGLAQELAAKIRLDRLTLLAATQVHLLRDGELVKLPVDEIVQDDVIALQVGEYIAADGPLLEAEFLEVDEALLTGESDPVARQPGEQLLAGSFCVAGSGLYRAEKVGLALTSQRMTQEARRHRYVPGPIQQSIDYIIRWLSYVAIGLTAVYVLRYWVHPFLQTALAQMVAATVTSMVPQGLVLTATLALTWGAIRLTRQGAVVQRLDAVEAMAAVSVLCLDKTGTLTTNQLQLEYCILLDQSVGEEEARRRVRSLVSASVDSTNKVLAALRQFLGEVPVDKLDELPFKAQNRFSAVRFRDGDVQRTMLLGGAEVMRKRLSGSLPVELEERWKNLLEEGLRLLVAGETTYSGALAELKLDNVDITPLVLIGFRDALRPQAAAALESLSRQGITFKILSGDHPQTVRSALAHLKIPLDDGAVISGQELAESNQPQELINHARVFGRLTPRQKLDVIGTLQKQGQFVAMLGDGVNDILSIKQADLGIAMGDGSTATKAVAGLVLLHNDFTLLPAAMEEARIAVHNLRRAGKLFLIKNVFTLLFIGLAMVSVAVAFPYLPQQVTLLNILTIGLPAAIVTFGRIPGSKTNRRHFLREIGWFALGTGAVMGAGGCLLLIISAMGRQDEAMLQRSLLLAFLICFVPQTMLRALHYQAPKHSPNTMLLLLVSLLAVPLFALVMYVRITADFFQLQPLTPADWLLVLSLVVPTAGVIMLLDRWTSANRVLERPSPPAP